MSFQSWQETLAAAFEAGSALNTYTTAQSILPTSALFTVPADYFQRPGRVLRVTAAGSLSNIVTTPGTVHFQVKLGSVIAFTTGNLQFSTTAHTTLPFWLQVLLTCRSVGSGTSATLMGQGVLFSPTLARTAVADSTETDVTLLAPATAPAVGTGFDSTSANQVDLFCGFSISDAGNGVQLQQYLLESLN